MSLVNFQAIEAAERMIAEHPDGIWPDDDSLGLTTARYDSRLLSECMVMPDRSWFLQIMVTA